MVTLAAARGLLSYGPTRLLGTVGERSVLLVFVMMAVGAAIGLLFLTDRALGRARRNVPATSG